MWRTIENLVDIVLSKVIKSKKLKPSDKKINNELALHHCRNLEECLKSITSYGTSGRKLSLEEISVITTPEYELERVDFLRKNT